MIKKSVEDASAGLLAEVKKNQLKNDVRMRTIENKVDKLLNHLNVPLDDDE